MQPNKLFVANISFEATEEMIRALFEEMGPVEDFYYARDHESGRPRGFAFITMATDEEAAAAIEKLNGYVLNERDLRVSIAIPKEDRPRPSRGDGGGYGGGHGGGYGGGHGGGYGGGDRGPRAPRLNSPRGGGGGYRGGGGGYRDDRGGGGYRGGGGGGGYRGGGGGGYRDDRRGGYRDGGGGGYRDDRGGGYRDDRRGGYRDGGERHGGERPPQTWRSDDE